MNLEAPFGESRHQLTSGLLAHLFIVGLVLLTTSCGSSTQTPLYSSELLEIRKLTDNSYVHVSMLQGKTTQHACNGMIYIHDGKAVVFDTPTTNEAAAELIRYTRKQLNAKIVAVVPTHFHKDCLGGLRFFHSMGISSVGNKQTRSLAKNVNTLGPVDGFEKEKTIQLGDREVVLYYPGAGHTQDNIVGYVPAEGLLFGGCLVKSHGASKGNLEDADVAAWPLSIDQLAERFPDIKQVVPGHGQPGDASLLEYTRELFASQGQEE